MKKKLSKKGMEWSTIGKIVLILVSLLLVLYIVYKVSGKSFDLVDKIKELF